MQEKNVQVSFNFMVPLQIILIILKMGGILNVSWGIILLPLWTILGLLILGITLIIIAFIIG